MSTLFDIVGDINFGKKNLLRTGEIEESEYNSFIINRALSFSHETILYANEMNKNHGLSKQQQYDYYIHSIRKAKRYNKWIKQNKHKDIEAIQEYYNCNFSKATNILKILSVDQIKEIYEILDKGGKE